MAWYHHSIVALISASPVSHISAKMPAPYLAHNRGSRLAGRALELCAANFFDKMTHRIFDLFVIATNPWQVGRRTSSCDFQIQAGSGRFQCSHASIKFERSKCLRRFFLCARCQQV
jgi:hypothetical protein